jgi:hypothetical protein
MGYLTRFSANSEYSSNTSSEAPESLSNDLRVDSNADYICGRMNGTVT